MRLPANCCCSACRSAPGRSCRSMRLSQPSCPSKSCAAPISITISAGPAAAMLPATCTGTWPRPTCRTTLAGPSGRPSAWRALALRNTVRGANSARRSCACHGRGISAGAVMGSCSASAATRCSVVSWPSAVEAFRSASRIGLACATCGLRAISAYSACGSRPWRGRSCRSLCPLAARAAWANSASALALMRCTASASATPSITAVTAARLRHGCWRRSCQEKTENRPCMAVIVLRWPGAPPGS